MTKEATPTSPDTRRVEQLDALELLAERELQGSAAAVATLRIQLAAAETKLAEACTRLNRLISARLVNEPREHPVAVGA